MAQQRGRSFSRPAGAESTLTENASSLFHAEPRHIDPKPAWEVSPFSSHASICGDIFISWGTRFSPYGGKVNLSRCFYSPAILTSCVNPHFFV